MNNRINNKYLLKKYLENSTKIAKLANMVIAFVWRCACLRRFTYKKPELRGRFRHIDPATRKSNQIALPQYMRRAIEILRTQWLPNPAAASHRAAQLGVVGRLGVCPGD